MKDNKFLKQLFADGTGFDSGAYCDFSSSAAQAISGKDVLLAVWNAEGTKLLAIAGQQSLDISRSAETSEVVTKDSDGSWNAAVSGMKSWSISTDGVYVADDESHKILGAAFENGDNLCVKVYNKKHSKGLYGGVAILDTYDISAPYDDSMTYSINLTGVGKLTDFSLEEIASDTMPTA